MHDNASNKKINNVDDDDIVNVDFDESIQQNDEHNINCPLAEVIVIECCDRIWKESPQINEMQFDMQ